MDGFNGVNEPWGDNMFWGLPVAFALEESAAEMVSNMTDEERKVLRERSSGITSEKEMDELVRMVVEGRFE